MHFFFWESTIDFVKFFGLILCISTNSIWFNKTKLIHARKKKSTLNLKIAKQEFHKIYACKLLYCAEDSKWKHMKNQALSQIQSRIYVFHSNAQLMKNWYCSVNNVHSTAYRISLIKRDCRMRFYGYFLAWMDSYRPEREPLLVFKF